MKNTVVLYKSKYGSTKKYAKWISDELKADLYDSSNIKLKDILNYDVIVYGGGLYASGINGISFIRKNFNILKNKNIIVFTIGLSPADSKELKSIIDKNFKEDMKKNIKFFHFRGGIDYKNLSFIHRIMMNMLRKMIMKKKKEDITDDEKAFLDTFGNKVDFADKNTIKPLVDYVKSL